LNSACKTRGYAEHTPRLSNKKVKLVDFNIRKMDPLRVCENFRDLNVAATKDEYLISVADVLVGSTSKNEIKFNEEMVIWV
jgi:hypothetical protein